MCKLFKFLQHASESMNVNQNLSNHNFGSQQKHNTTQMTSNSFKTIAEKLKPYQTIFIKTFQIISNNIKQNYYTQSQTK